MKIAVYGRVSTQEQREGKTIDSQIQELRQFAEGKGWEEAGEYLDDGWSGAVLERPGLDRLRDDARNGKFTSLLVHHPDRLSRVQLHQLLLLDEFEKRKIEVVFSKLPEFSEQSEESRVINKSVWSMVSELERLRIRERTRRGRRHKAESKGMVVGNIPPYGYDYVKKDRETKKEGYYKVNPEEARVVKMMFKWVKEGMSELGVVRKLTEMKIPRRNPPKNSKKPPWVWARSTVHKILTNETYTGVTYYNKHESVEPKNPLNKGRYRKTAKGSRRLRPRSDWIPIQLSAHLQLVSKEDFDFVQEQLARNKTYSKRNAKKKYLLRGLIKCKKCGSPYYADSSHGRPNYRCGNKMKMFPLPKTCNGGMISAQVIEPLVWGMVRKAVMQPKLILSQAERFEVEASQKVDKVDETEKLLGQLRDEEGKILEAYRKSVIDVDQLRDQLDEIKTRRKALAKTAEMAVKQPSPKLLEGGVTWLLKEISKAIDALNFEEKQQFLRLLIDEIILGENKVFIKGILPIYDQVEPNRQIAPTTFFSRVFPGRVKPCWLGLWPQFFLS